MVYLACDVLDGLCVFAHFYFAQIWGEPFLRSSVVGLFKVFGDQFVERFPSFDCCAVFELQFVDGHVWIVVSSDCFYEVYPSQI